MQRLIVTRLLPLLLAVSLPATAATPSAEATLRDAENQWSQAFLSGDAQVLGDLLDPAYVSVSAAGAPRTRDEVIALARKYAAQHPGESAKPLPPTSTIQVKGELGIVRHHGPNDVSVDVFYRADGRWHALYSQHTAVGG